MDSGTSSNVTELPAEPTEGRFLGMQIVKRSKPRTLSSDPDQRSSSANGLVDFDLVLTYEEKPRG